jgi:hypothetical protein
VPAGRDIQIVSGIGIGAGRDCGGIGHGTAAASVRRSIVGDRSVSEGLLAQTGRLLWLCEKYTGEAAGSDGVTPDQGSESVGDCVDDWPEE